MKKPTASAWARLGLICCLLFARPAATQGANAPAGVFHVALDGDDHWSGTIASPNRRKSDGPFATINRAVEACRDWRKAHVDSSTAKLTILIAPGVYPQPQPLTLKPEDSHLVIGAASKEMPVLSGGLRITNWKQMDRDGKTVWAAAVPNHEQWNFRELWMNGRRAVRARYPNQGYLKVAGLVDPAPEWTKGQSRFQYNPGDLKAWNGLNEGEIVVMNRWSDSRLPITRIDEAQHVISFGKRSVFALEKGDLYYLEGVLEALDQPGEWYFDRRAGTLYYMPRAGESLNQLEAFAPVLSQVVRLEGNPDGDNFVENIVFRGLAFSHTEWCFPDGFSSGKDKPEIFPQPEAEVGGFGQAEIGVPGAVWGRGIRECAFENCAFRNLGNYGLELGQGCQSNRVSRCEFSELGAGGIKLGETVIQSKPALQTRGNEVRNCRIHDGGQMFHSAIGVWIGQSPDNGLVHNEIHDFYYTGISIGWTWGYGPALASNNLVAFNHVHHIGIKSNGDGPILSDMGGIYTLGKQPGSRVINNFWHDIAGLRYGGWGIYFDEGSSGIVASSNVVYNTTHGGFHQHYGETNVVRNNIFAFGRDQQLQRTRVEPHVSFSFQTNIVYFNEGVLLSGDWSKDAYDIDWNIYYDTRDAGPVPRMRFEKATFDEWRARGHDTHSVIADPLFVAPEKHDFHLRAASPALKLGFAPIDLRHVGVEP
jgi:hypothetical protein